LQLFRSEGSIKPGKEAAETSQRIGIKQLNCLKVLAIRSEGSIKLGKEAAEISQRMAFFLRRQFFYTQDPKQQRRSILKSKRNKEDLTKLERKDQDQARFKLSSSYLKTKPKRS